MLIWICGLNQVSDMVKRCGASHVVSLLDMNTRAPRPGVQGHLVEHMEDAEHQQINDAPKLEQIERVLAWTKELPADARLLVHCHAGVSRSTAMAMAIWVQQHGTDFEACDTWLQLVRPQAAPNRLIAAHADRVLGTKGRLLKLAHDITARSMFVKFDMDLKDWDEWAKLSGLDHD